MKKYNNFNYLKIKALRNFKATAEVRKMEVIKLKQPMI